MDEVMCELLTTEQWLAEFERECETLERALAEAAEVVATTGVGMAAIQAESPYA